MVETFTLIKGKKPLPTFDELMQDVYNGRIMGVSRFCNHPNRRNDMYSVCLQTTVLDGSMTYLHVHRDIDPYNPDELRSEAILMFSRFGNNFEAARIILPLICKRYGCGCKSDSDGIIIQPEM